MRHIYVAFKGLKHDERMRELKVLRVEKTQAFIYVYKYLIGGNEEGPTGNVHKLKDRIL